VSTEIANRKSGLSPAKRELFELRVRRRAAAPAAPEPHLDVNTIEWDLMQQPWRSNGTRTWDAVRAASVMASLNESLSESSAIELEGHTEGRNALGRLCTGYVSAAFQTMDVFTTSGETYSMAELMERLQVLPTFERALRRLVEILVEDNLLEKTDGTYRSRRPLPTPPLGGLLEEARRQLPMMPFIFDFLQRSGENLPEVLTGKMHPTQLLFPDGASDMAENIYSDSPPFRYCNSIAREATRAAAECLPSGSLLRVLEVGAGTGSTTSSLLPVLAPDQSVYVFTDISSYFLNLAKEKFDGYRFLRYALLDLERDPLEQGFRKWSFDLIVAAHVLHATARVRETVRNLTSLLAPGGILILMEETRLQRYFNLTMGLQSGFDRFTDTELRTTHPLLTGAQWEQMLLENGFETFESFPETFGIQVFLARAWSDAG
jgi:SAM-dependent methyltransferase